MIHCFLFIRNLLNKCGKQNPGLIQLIFKEEAGLEGKLALYCLRKHYNSCSVSRYKDLVLSHVKLSHYASG